MSEFQPKTLKNVHGDERRVTTVAEQVAAEFDGFVEKLPSRSNAGSAQPKPEPRQRVARGSKKAGSAKAQAQAGGTAGTGGEKTPATVTPPA